MGQCPPETAALLNAERGALLPDGAIVDEDALIAALR